MLCCVSKKAAAGADLEPPLLGLRCGRIVANRASSVVTNSEKLPDPQLTKEKVDLNHQEELGKRKLKVLAVDKLGQDPIPSLNRPSTPPLKMDLEGDLDVPSILMPCAICARTFAPKSLEKHVKICERSSIKKRKPFDSSKQRIQGTELEEFLPKQENKRPHQDERIGTSKSTWKQTHDEFLRTIRAARGEPIEVQTKQSKNQILSGAPTRANEKGVCPTCCRQFGIKAYERHVAWCKERSTRVQISAATNIAKERLEARIRYRAPALKNRRPTIREKYMPGSASNLGYTAKISSSPANPIKPRESVSLPNCNKSTESLAKHKLAARKPNQSSISIPTGPLKSRPMDRANRPVEDLIPDPSRPQNSSFSFPSTRIVSPLNLGKYANSPGKSCENYLTKFDTRTVTGPISHRANVNLRKTEKFHFLSTRSYESSQLNDISVNNDEFGLMVQPCPLRKNEITWKQISRENSNFKANLVSKLNLSALKKSIEKDKTTSKEDTERTASDKETFIEKEEELVEIPSWMSEVRKLDQTFLIYNNPDKTLDNTITEKTDSENFVLGIDEETSEGSSLVETSDTEFLETSRTVLVSPTKFNANISFTSTPISCRRKEQKKSFSENQIESSELEEHFLEETKEIFLNEVNGLSSQSTEEIFPNFCNSTTKNERIKDSSRESSKTYVINTSSIKLPEGNRCTKDSNLDEPVKKRRRTDEDIQSLDFLNNESIEYSSLDGESKLNIEEEKINTLLVGLKLDDEHEIAEKEDERPAEENQFSTNDQNLEKENCQPNNLEMRAIDSVESIVIRTKNLKICDDESQTDLQIKEELVTGKLNDENNFSLQTRKSKGKTEENKSKDVVINRKQLMNERIEIEEFSKFSEIRETDNKKKKYFLNKIYNENKKNDSEKRLKILFRSNIPLQISRSNTQIYDEFWRNRKRKKRKEKEYFKKEEIDFTTVYSLRENRFEDETNNRFINTDSQLSRLTLSEVKRKIRCNIDRLRSSTDSLISSVEEKVSNLKTNVSDYFINETCIIEEIKRPQAVRKYALLPILENSINLRDTQLNERNFGEVSHWKQVSRIPVHRLIGSGTMKDYRHMRLEKRNPRYYKLPFVAGKLSLGNKTYDPFLMAEQQMQDLLSDTSDQFSTDGLSTQTNRQNSTLFPLTHSSAFVTYPHQSLPNPIDSSKKRGSVLAPPSEFDDLNSDFSSDCTETNSISRELFVNDLISQTRDAIGNSTNKEKPNQDHILARRVIIDKSKALGTDVEDSSRGRSSIASVEKTRKILDKISAPKGIRPLVNRSHSVRAASAPKIPERKNSSSSDSSGFQKKNFKCSKSSDLSFADRSNNNLNSKNSSSYTSTINGSNLSLNSSVSSDVDMKRSNSMFDELMSSFEEDSSTILPSLKSLLKSDPLSMSSPIQNTAKRNGLISDDELSSIDSFKRQDHGKLSADSAYSSLNRKYNNHGRSTNDMASRLEEDPPARYREGDSRFLSKSKMSKFCHECGSRFPESAKFCCECGIKRLTL